MKCTEYRELRDLSMNQLNAKLSELYKELHRSQE
jgi:ribosomal protein L29